MNLTLASQIPTFFSSPSRMRITLTDRDRPARAKVHTTCAEMTFNRNQIREVKHPLGITIECTSGQVWITLDNDPRDVVLAKGQTFTVDRDKRTLVMALYEATVRCTTPVSA
jgi:hypothetical protein